MATLQGLPLGSLGNRWLRHERNEDEYYLLSPCFASGWQIPLASPHAICYPAQMKWISPQGEIIQTKDLDEFCRISKLSRNTALRLGSGYRARMNGWCSTSRKAKALRDRFMTKLVNVKTGETCILGQSGRAFSERHSLCFNELMKLINGHRFIYRHWTLEKTLKLASGSTALTAADF